jgi:hypothetical protein
LDDDDGTVRRIALALLKDVSSDAKDSITYLTGILDNTHETPDRRSRAARALGVIGNESPESILALVTLVTNQRQPEIVRESAAEAFQDPSLRLPAASIPKILFLAMNYHETPALRGFALACLGKSGRDAEAAMVPLSILLLDRGQSLEMRRKAAQTIGQIAAESQVSSPTDILIRILRDRSENVVLRREAVHALDAMRETARRAIPTLNELVVEKTEPRDLRLDMITALQRVAQGTRASSAQLLQIADDPNENKNLRVGALQALASVGPDEEGVRILTNILKNTTGDLDLRRAAINPLMSQDTRAKEALPILRTILVNRSENSDLRAEAGQAIALTKSGSLEDSAALVMVVKDSEEPTELRSKIAYDLGILDPQSSGAATVLARIAADQQADLSLRRGTVDALRMIRRNGPGVIPALRNILYEHDADFQLRRSAVAAFGGIAADEKSLNAEAIPVLVDVIKHSDDPQMRQNAISYLGQMDPGSTELDRFLIQTAEDSQDDPTIRQQAISALGVIGRNYRIDESIPALLRLLREEKEPVRLRQSVADSLAVIRIKPSSAIPALLGVLQKQDEDTQLRLSAARSLGLLSPESADVASALAFVSGNRNEDAGLRASSAEALGRQGAQARPFLPLLYTSLDDQNTSIQYGAALGLTTFASTANADGATNLLREVKRTESELARRPSLSNSIGRDGTSYINTVHQARLSLERQSLSKTMDAISNLITYQHPRIFLSCAVVLVWYLMAALMLWVSPLTILTISEWCSRRSGVKINTPIIAVSSELVPIYPFPRYPRRALDRWVSRYATTARSNFQSILTVRDRDKRVSLPVRIDGSLIQDVTPTILKSIFDRERKCVVISGEGGAGKTTLACQIGKWSVAEDEAMRISRHLMLPVFIEGDIHVKIRDDEDLLEQTIRGKLMHLIGEVEPPSVAMMTSLLKSSRILVIIDGFSEMRDGARASVSTENPRFSPSALLVTSRFNENLQTMGQSYLIPERLGGSTLSHFVEEYLRMSGHIELFPRENLHRLCLELQTMIGDRDITPLFATLYVDYAIASKEETGLPSSRPENIPTLILEYLSKLNRKVAAQVLDDATVLRAAKVIAWECLRENLRPTPAKTDRVLRALEEIGATKDDLRYLELRLRLIESIEPGEELRFRLDPLAEYLAALYVVERNEADKERWQAFLESVDRIPGSPGKIRGFLVAVRDCYRFKYPSPEQDSVATELGNRLVKMVSTTAPHP